MKSRREILDMTGEPVFYNAHCCTTVARMRVFGLISSLGLCALLSVFSAAQNHRALSCGHSQVAETPAIPVPESILNAPIAIESGLGEFHRKVGTSSSEVQAYYDQGSAFLYSYDWIHAVRSFHEALRRDPQLAVAYLGLSYAFSGLGEEDRAADAAGKAQELAADASPPERVLISLRQIQLQAIRSGTAEDLKHYQDALDTALKDDPENITLLLMRGNATEGFAAAIGQRGASESISYYETILQLDPNNAAAHHFLVHANEMVGNLPEAVKHGQAYAALAPAVPHAQHMYGHDLRRVGRLREAIAQFEKARVLAKKSYVGDDAGLQYDWNYRHNLSLLAGAYHQAEEWKSAEQTARELALLPVNNAGDDYYRKELALIFLERRRYQEALAASQSLMKSRFRVGRVLGHAIAGLAYAGLKQPQHVSNQLLAVHEETSGLDDGWRYTLSPWTETLEMVTKLQGPDRTPAVARLIRQEQEMRSRPGADAWSDALFHLELIDHLAMELGAWDLAEFTAKQMREHAPEYGGTHLALLEVARHR